MSQYRAELAELYEFAVYNQPINQELFDLLESLYNEQSELDDYSLLKQIYILLSDEVDDPEYYDLGLDEDNDDLIEILHQYCSTFLVDKTKLSIELGRYVTQPEERHFESYDDFHQALANALKLSVIIEENDNASFLAWLLNDIIESDIKLKSEMIERKEPKEKPSENYFKLF
ncbi:hypothetical protein [Sphingobacterium sp. 1.A.5]|uniref:hypothetical protein n=1 Tax=Sphingobacterium sp. 1.A.5 TaxID=2044604 RepID=UPI000C0BD9E5|nr:hypothetical protein [Sphingobacterium sp. 1.A.5]